MGFFSRYGHVLAVRLPKGKMYGFVDVADAATVAAMIGGLNGVDLRGHAIKVQAAGAKERGGGGGGSFGGGSYGSAGGGGVSNHGASRSKDLFALAADADPKGEPRITRSLAVCNFSAYELTIHACCAVLWSYLSWRINFPQR